MTAAPSTARPAKAEAAAPALAKRYRLVEVSTVGLFLLAGCGVLYFAAGLLLPLVLAFLFAMVLAPLVRTLHGYRIPEAAAAICMVGALAGVVGAGSYLLSGPVSYWASNAPRVIHELRTTVSRSSGSSGAGAAQEASEQIRKMTDTSDPSVRQVVVQQPGLISRAASGTLDLGAKALIVFVLLFFLLASGDMFYEKLVQVMPNLSDKKRAVRIAREVEQEVSRYLLTITMINVGLGACIGATMFALGVPDAALWAVVATVMNFIPYLGPALGIGIIAFVSFATFHATLHALMPPLAVLALVTLEGQFLTPIIVGRRLELNAVAIFIAVAFWGWLWGIFGAFLAVPILVTTKVLCDHVTSLHDLGAFLSARGAEFPETPAEAAESPALGK